MTISKLAMAAKKVIDAAFVNGPSYDLASVAAFALESACMLQSPETAAELEKLRAERDEFCDRVDTLTAVAKGNKRHVAEMFAELQKVQRERDEALARVAELEAAQKPSDTYPPALPWAVLMDDEDLSDFLDELAASAITHASSEVALAEVEKTCSTWRLIAEAQHAHNTAPGPDAETDGITVRVAPTQALREVPDGEHYAQVHHDYRIPHDLPDPEATR